jgi:hypothetical protein
LGPDVSHLHRVPGGARTRTCPKRCKVVNAPLLESRSSARTHTHTHTHTQSACVSTSACIMCVCTNTCIHLCTCKSTHITGMHTYISMSICIHMHTQSTQTCHTHCAFLYLYMATYKMYMCFHMYKHAHMHACTDISCTSLLQWVTENTDLHLPNSLAGHQGTCPPEERPRRTGTADPPCSCEPDCGLILADTKRSWNKTKALHPKLTEK